MAVIELDPNAHKREMPSIYVRFYTQETEDLEAVKITGHSVPKFVDRAEWGQKGQNLNMPDEPIARIRRNADLWRVIGPAYEAWKKNQEPPLTGTPLKSWPAISAAQVRKLQEVGIRTVEDLEALSDSNAERAGIMEINRLRTRAKLWREAANDIGKIAERLNAIEEANKVLVERNAELERGNTELRGALESSGKVQAPAIPSPQRKSA